jgi:hypothetical protein
MKFSFHGFSLKTDASSRTVVKNKQIDSARAD